MKHKMTDYLYEGDTVKVLIDRPEFGIKRGDIGVLIDISEDGSHIVEFIPEDGRGGEWDAFSRTDLKLVPPKTILGQIRRFFTAGTPMKRL